MFNVSALEILVILIVALLVFGPERLPALAKSLGLWMSQAKRALAHIKHEFEKASEEPPSPPHEPPHESKPPE